MISCILNFCRALDPELGAVLHISPQLFLKRSWPNLVGLHVTQKTRDSDLKALLIRLWPRQCDAELIRVGGPGDGGYLMPNLLSEIEICISPGIGSTSEFEKQLAAYYNINSILIDPNRYPVGLQDVEYTHLQKFVGIKNDPKYISLNQLTENYTTGHQSAILQMDIEGAEYLNLLDAQIDSLQRFRILVIEFHNVHHWLSKPFFDCTVKPLFDKLLNIFFVVHVHANNFGFYVHVGHHRLSNTLEVTFLNRKSSCEGKLVDQLPHRLDSRNSAAKPDIPFPRV